jgi:hypothetical protein
MPTDIQKSLEVLIAVVIKEGRSRASRDKVTYWCERNPIEVCQAIYDRIAKAKTRCEVRGDYGDADNLGELMDAAHEVMSEKMGN